MSKTLKVYHYPICSTCRLANKQLKEQGYQLDDQDIKQQPPTVEELRRLIPLSGLPIAKWFNTSGEVYRELGLKDKVKTMSEDEKIKLLSGHGMLIKRPIVTDGVKVTVGYKSERFAEEWPAL
ncbi:MAG: arsenate reductase family protein [Candidatus Cohnella colombiensis]|uniref:Arsenate reductase family protein n=1 Tax=Candidatus Cohnella colombiensis TaxID=3121368 RepID=A0AA95F043_9BACL|nr:MAG: arsenate reductase family protein [Cohnella sp.]